MFARAMFTLTVAAAISAGCRTLPEFAPLDVSDSEWRRHEGQAVWRPEHGAPGIAGELFVARRGTNDLFVQFAKPPLSIVVAQRDETGWRARFGDGREIGGAGAPPEGFLWLQLPRILEGASFAPSPSIQIERTPDGGWSLERPETGESIRGFLEPAASLEPRPKLSLERE